jgi:hypothetical protein
MKKLILLVIAGCILSACSDNKARESAVLDTVIKAHDKVMGEDEQLMKNKMQLDGMAKKNPAGDIKDSVSMYLDKVNAADSAMDAWMHNFNPDLTGKSHEQKMTYLDDQKRLITQVDSQINSAVTASGKFLTKMKMK